KQSDVNLALHLYDDAVSGDVDQVVLVTNDTDLTPALEMLQARCPHIVRGLVIPTRGEIADQVATSRGRRGGV
ncbi:NYN domain-containing protein, partial [Rhizobium ruizarguesonis]